MQRKKSTVRSSKPIGTCRTRICCAHPTLPPPRCQRLSQVSSRPLSARTRVRLLASWHTEVNPTAWDIYDPGNSFYGEVHWVEALVSRTLQVSGASHLRIVNDWYSPGNVTAPTLPATTVAKKNDFYRDAAVSIRGGTVTVISVDGVQVASATNTTVIVPSGKNITLTYSVAPTWVWTLL